MTAREFALINDYFDQPGLSFQSADVELGIGDDCALIAVANGDNLALSMDTLIADIHFPREADPYLVGCRALAVNLSDLAAMGARPLCFSLSIALPGGAADEQWLAGFSRGLGEYAQRYDCPLVGGDTTSGPLSLTIAVHGRVASEAAWRRSGAQEGDRIYVTGTLGDAAIALKILGLRSHLDPHLDFDHTGLSDESRGRLLRAYYQPAPRLELAAGCGKWIGAAIDISDGLLGDLGHICRSSGVGADVELGSLPYSEETRTQVPLSVCEAAALGGGDDYELCFTVGEADVPAFERAAAEASIRVSNIGRITSGKGVRCLDSAGNPITPGFGAYAHFGGNEPVPSSDLRSGGIGSDE